MTTIQWDHTVHNVNHLEDVISRFKENGLSAFKGGSHKQWGTHNALSYFGLTYLEFLGIEDRKLAENTDGSVCFVKDAVAMLPAKEAISRVALRSDDIEETAASLKTRGLKLSPIMDGKRLNSLGELIEWRMLTIAGEFHGLAYPFVIQWKGNDQERLDKLTASGLIQSHPAGDVTIEAAVFTVPNPGAVAAHWQELFRFMPAGVADSSAKLDIKGKSFIFKQGKENRLTQLTFRTEARVLKGTTITIGEADYVFK
ncbi:VOC family protein [Bacillus sp. M6-12]|uniref:VOC family protein n=1 Tax=Bacillus sp. M6-12 TaxID=2054166 RepID=UPI000C78986F|nr:VOC family protein [Bacillus sp. M6-12]PLS17674.1 VOC family protein [Bacillus sp. M6-12]